MNINKLNSMRGSSFIETPPFIAKKRAISNVKNNEQECFKWATTIILLGEKLQYLPNSIGKYLVVTLSAKLEVEKHVNKDLSRRSEVKFQKFVKLTRDNWDLESIYFILFYFILFVYTGQISLFLKVYFT